MMSRRRLVLAVTVLSLTSCLATSPEEPQPGVLKLQAAFSLPQPLPPPSAVGGDGGATVSGIHDRGFCGFRYEAHFARRGQELLLLLDVIDVPEMMCPAILGFTRYDASFQELDPGRYTVRLTLRERGRKLLQEHRLGPVEVR